MKQCLSLVALLIATASFAITETTEAVRDRLKSPAFVCVMGDPCSEDMDKVSTVNIEAPSEDGINTIKMLNSGTSGTMVFEPAILKIAVGESVNFVPTDGGHNSAAVSGLIPEGVEAWEGGMSEEIEITFDKEGVYVYQCTPHVMMAMVGVITVGNPTNLEQILVDSKKLEQSFIMNKDRLSGYLSAIK